MDSERKPKNLCLQCAHFMRAEPPRLFTVSANAGPGELEAARKWREMQKERAEAEQIRVQQHDPLFVEPQFFNWCQRFTLTPKQAGEFRAELLAGDETTEARWRARHYDFKIDYANGEVRPIYALCAVVNTDGSCQGFKPRSRDAR